MRSEHRAVAVIGESLVDIIRRGGTRVTSPGGSPLNVAVGLARLGVTPTFVTRIGADDNGRLLTAHLTASGVPLDGVVEGERTSSAVATIREDGSADYRFDVAWELPPLPTPPAAVLHTGSLGAWLDPGAEEVGRMLRGREPGVLASVDANVRPSLIPDRERALDRLLRAFAAADIAKLSDEDADWMWPGLASDEIVDRVLAGGSRLVVLTLGGRGALLATRRARVAVTASASVVVDTIGAGDSFMAGLLAHLVVAGQVEAVLADGLESAMLCSAGEFAARCAAITVGREGADPPRATEVDWT